MPRQTSLVPVSSNYFYSSSSTELCVCCVLLANTIGSTRCHHRFRSVVCRPSERPKWSIERRSKYGWALWRWSSWSWSCFESCWPASVRKELKKRVCKCELSGPIQLNEDICHPLDLCPVSERAVSSFTLSLNYQCVQTMHSNKQTQFSTREILLVMASTSRLEHKQWSANCHRRSCHSQHLQVAFLRRSWPSSSLSLALLLSLC